MNFRDEVLALAAAKRDELLAEIGAIQRELEEIEAFAGLVRDWKTRRDWKKTPEPKKHGAGGMMRAVLARLDANEPKTVRELAEELTVPVQNIQPSLNRLVKAGRVRRTSEQRGTRTNPTGYLKVAVVEEVPRANVTVFP